jgi:tRNA (adenine57-N1/adenine58-N1)-methyltransferase catalytic subunit
MAPKISPFLDPGPIATADSLSIIHLKRDHQVPTILRERDDDDEGYQEGKVVNTRFGSFPHSTLIGLPWGSQVRASKVDTGSRGRRVKGGEKRKRDDFEAKGSEPAEDTSTTVKEAVAASSGFIHLLPPTPENWTSSLPHRTQVVYTPDYSYVLHRLRARPGTRIIEAGAGSGSFTHASARAVYSGYPEPEKQDNSVKKWKIGKVWSYEFHEQRHAKLGKEIQDHGLEGIVQITHRDVCRDGFLIGANTDESPNADAVFLDLPAPWLALPHLTRQPRSPLNPHSTVHICTFSPCIEQVQRTVSTLRRLGWVDISMVEVAQKRLEIRRERIGIENGLQRGVQATAANVEEAIARLLEVEGRFKSFHGSTATVVSGQDGNGNGNGVENGDEAAKVNDSVGSNEKGVADEAGGRMDKNIKDGELATLSKNKNQNPNSHAAIISSLLDRKIYKEGRLSHRAEPELKTHTSYLVFAVLPREWSAEDEEQARARWPLKSTPRKKDRGEAGNETVVGVSPRQAKRVQKEKEKEKERDKQAMAREKADIGGNITEPGDGGNGRGDVDMDINIDIEEPSTGQGGVGVLETVDS